MVRAFIQCAHPDRQMGSDLRRVLQEHDVQAEAFYCWKSPVEYGASTVSQMAGMCDVLIAIFTPEAIESDLPRWAEGAEALSRQNDMAFIPLVIGDSDGGKYSSAIRINDRTELNHAFSSLVESVRAIADVKDNSR